MRNAIVIAIGLVIAAAVLAQSGEPVVLTTANPNKIQPVNVQNFPDPQAVTGTVEVGNLPAVQEVTGTVAVSNLPPTRQPRMQLVGFSNDTLDAGAGVLSFTLACQRVFPNSRMCSTEEVMETVQIPSAPVPPGNGIVKGWVRPRIVGINSGLALDISGASDALSNGGLSCNGWEFNSSDRIALTLAYDSDAAQFYRIFDGEPCNLFHRVACCAPV